MDIDVPEGTEPVEPNATTQSSASHSAPDSGISAGELTRDSEPSAKRHKPHNPQFSSIASTVLQRMKQSKEGTSSATPPSATMAMPPPSQPSQESPEPQSDKACTACTQTSSSLFNPLVQCRRCLGHWHRLCYEPSIPDFLSASSLSFSSESNSKWACVPCEEAASASRQQRLQQRANTKDDHLKIESPSFLQRAAISKPASNTDTKTVSWAHRSAEERRAYVASLAPRDMAYWLFRAVEQYPDFAMFPEEVVEKAAPAPEPAPAPAPANTTNTTDEVIVTRPPQYRNGIINSIRKSQAPAPAAPAKVPRRIVPETATFSTSEAFPRTKPLFEATPADPDDDPTGLMDGWPRPGRGMYAAAGADWLVETAALADSNDHLSFSSIVYDESGHKVRENGMPLLVHS